MKKRTSPGPGKAVAMKRQKQSILSGLKSYKEKYIPGEKTRLRQKKLTDARDDYRWQSDPELAHLDAAPVLKLSFAVYLLDYVDSIRRPGKKRFPLSIETLKGKHIGNCTCYDIDEENSEAQVGIMIGDRDYWDRGYGSDAFMTLVDHLFLKTIAKRVYLKTLDWNMRAQKCFQNCGFTEYSRSSRNGYNFLFMEMTRKQWQKSFDRRRDESLTH
ncbi:MAG: GNAT family N-acetyltransferase [Dehalococcoidia bacterium]|jgi:RimJ/RimL family protein N-acetyltransferase